MRAGPGGAESASTSGEQHQAKAAIPAYLDKTFAALTAAERRQLTALLGKLLVPAG
ncbi:hypothetical protein AB0L63_08475 [Nocardia sp. NPDC051990]|uniref:hypothetical protein n=1 Tax=Nocardia sp. NPDC051990 TaxID=3155285 RepID=UPI0034406FA4